MRISEFLSQDHRAGDGHFADLEKALARTEWARATEALESFAFATLHHFLLEEEILFPDLEDAMKQRSGPTEVMRLEHGEIRQLIDELQQAVLDHDMQAIAGTSDILNIMLQQHNAKEEQVLYPMIDRLQGGRSDDLLRRLKTAI